MDKKQGLPAMHFAKDYKTIKELKDLEFNFEEIRGFLGWDPMFKDGKALDIIYGHGYPLERMEELKKKYKEVK